MRWLPFALLTLLLVPASAPHASAGDTGLTAALEPNHLELDAGEAANILLLLNNTRDAPLMLNLSHAFESHGVMAEIQVAHAEAVTVPAGGIARVPVYVRPAPHAPASAHALHIDAVGSDATARASLDLEIRAGGGYITSEAGSLTMGTRVGTTSTLSLSIRNAGTETGIFSLRAQDAEGWEVTTSVGTFLAVGETRPHRVDWEPTATAPPSTKARLEVLRDDVPVETVAIILNVTAYGPPPRVELIPETVVVPRGASTTATLRITADPQVDELVTIRVPGFDPHGMGVPFSQGHFGVESANAPVAVAAGTSRDVPVNFTHRFGINPSWSASLAVELEDGSTIQVPFEVRVQTPANPPLTIEPERAQLTPNATAVFVVRFRNDADVPRGFTITPDFAQLHSFSVTVGSAMGELPPGGVHEARLYVTSPANPVPHRTTYVDAAIEVGFDDGEVLRAPIHIVSFHRDPGGFSLAGDPPDTWRLVAWLAGAGALLLGVAAAAQAAIRRWPLPLLALYARIRPARVLDHAARRELVEVIRAEPGITMAEAQRRLGLSNGQLAHHVRTLERARVIWVTRDGKHRRLTLVEDGPATTLATTILARVPEHRVRAAELARELGMSRQALHRQLHRLHAAGQLRVRLEGRHVVVERVRSAS